MKLLLIISAVLEGVIGLVLLLLPNVAVSLLLGAPLDTPTGLAAGRIGGAALIGLAISCWQARNGERGGPATGVVQAMLVYNLAAMLVLVYAGVRLQLHSTLLWPAILLHLGLGIYCVAILWFTRRRLAKSETAS